MIYELKIVRFILGNVKCKLEFVICILKIVRNCVFRQSQITRLLRLPICVYIYISMLETAGNTYIVYS